MTEISHAFPPAPAESSQVTNLRDKISRKQAELDAAKEILAEKMNSGIANLKVQRLLGELTQLQSELTATLAQEATIKNYDSNLSPDHQRLLSEKANLENNIQNIAQKISARAEQFPQGDNSRVTDMLKESLATFQSQLDDVSAKLAALPGSVS